MTRAVQIGMTIAGAGMLFISGFAFYAIPGDDKFIPFAIAVSGMCAIFAGEAFRD